MGSTSSMCSTLTISTCLTIHGRDVPNIFLVLFGNDDLLDAAAVGCNDSFSLSPPMGSTRPRRVISPVMETSRRAGRLVRAEMTEVHMAMPADGPSLGNGAFGNVDVQVKFAVELVIDVEQVGPRAHEADGGLGRLFHHVAQLSGNRHVSAAGAW